MPTSHWSNSIEEFIEAVIFWTRWILAPAYLILAACLVTLLFTTAVEFYELITRRIHLFAEATAITQVLTIVDLVLVMNLVLMIMFVGYTNFVSKIHPKESKVEDWPAWLGYLDYGGLKIQLLGSIIAVSAIPLLRAVVDLFNGGKVENDRFMWMAIFHLTFVFSAIIMALVNKQSAKTHGVSSDAD